MKLAKEVHAIVFTYKKKGGKTAAPIAFFFCRNFI